nr:hypothetical protein [uncultured bacterium]
MGKSVIEYQYYKLSLYLKKLTSGSLQLRRLYFINNFELILKVLKNRAAEY